jgi:leader peptidase (prepilin peptidase)/N-methyltransferase
VKSTPPHEPLSLARPGSRVPCLWACDHGDREHSGAELAVSPWPLFGVRGTDLAPLPAGRSHQRPVVRLCRSSISAMAGQLHCAMLLIWSLIALTCIDFDSQLLPDAITLPLLWAGPVVQPVRHLSLTCNRR